jgi:hypothetical protein
MVPFLLNPRLIYYITLIVFPSVESGLLPFLWNKGCIVVVL